MAPTPTKTKAPTKAKPAEPATSDGNDTPRISPAPKQRRRPLMMVLAIVAIVLGGLGGAFAIQSVSTAQSVVAARETIQRGETITAQDLMTVRIGVDPALHPIPAADIDTLIGKQAAYDIVAAGVVTAEQVTDTPIPTRGYSIIGVSVDAGAAPTSQLRPGSQVRLVNTPGAQGEVAKGNPEAIDATVVSIDVDQTSGATLLALQVSNGVAARAAAIASTGKAGIVLDGQG